MKKAQSLSLYIPALLSSFQEAPWFDDLYQFHLGTNFAYSHYTKVEGAVKPLKSPSNDYLVGFDTGVSPFPSVDIQFEVQFAETPRQSLGWRSCAMQGRYLWMDDALGDPVSLTSGISVRGVSSHSVRDVSSPFHSYFNLELNSAVGKEWVFQNSEAMHTFGLLGLGTGNRGLPWLRTYGEFAYHWQGHALTVFTEGYFGFGQKETVNIDNFYGWGRYRHVSIDMGLKYTYTFPIWGSLSVAYDRRLYAKTFPGNWNAVLLTYTLPFSLF